MRNLPFNATLPHWGDVKKITAQMLTLQGNTDRIMARSKMTDVAVMVGEERQGLNGGDWPQSPHHIKTT